jgi:hypothetical protein
MTGRSPMNVIVVNKERALITAHCESLPMGRGYRPIATLQFRSGVSLRVFIEGEGERL